MFLITLKGFQILEPSKDMAPTLNLICFLKGYKPCHACLNHLFKRNALTQGLQ